MSKKTSLNVAIVAISLLERLVKNSFELSPLQMQLASHHSKSIADQEAQKHEIEISKHVLEIVKEIETLTLIEPLLTNPIYRRYVRWLFGVNPPVVVPVPEPAPPLPAAAPEVGLFSLF